MKEQFIPIPEGEGFGFYGCPEHDEERDVVMCHQCGGWFKIINGGHLQSEACSKGVESPVANIRDYNAKYGYPLSFTHLTEILRAALREQVIDQQQKGKFCGRSRSGGHAKQTPRSAYELNQRDQCDLQLKHWVEEFIEEYGRPPNYTDCDHISSKQIRRRYGNWNQFLRKMGVADRKHGQWWGDDELLQYLRQFYDDHNRLARVSDFKRGLVGPSDKPVSYYVYHRRFKSLILARLKAGLPAV